jgi:hypothetical protein
LPTQNKKCFHILITLILFFNYLKIKHPTTISQGFNPIAPPLRGNKKDSIGHTIQENAVLSAACADTIRKLLELGDYNEVKEWTLL